MRLHEEWLAVRKLARVTNLVDDAINALNSRNGCLTRLQCQLLYLPLLIKESVLHNLASKDAVISFIRVDDRPVR